MTFKKDLMSQIKVLGVFILPISCYFILEIDIKIDIIKKNLMYLKINDLSVLATG